MVESIVAYRKSKDELYLSEIEKIRASTKFQKKEVMTSYGKIEVTLYFPTDAKDQKCPVYFNFHGGGFVLGFYEQDGGICQRIAETVTCIVVNVDYLLAPENPFPIPILSAAQVVEKVLAELSDVDREEVYIGGFSAGGTIAAGVVKALADQKVVPVKGLVTVYAPLDLSIEESQRTSARPELAISPGRMADYKNWYLGDLANDAHPYASPGLGDLSQLPPTLVIAAEYDSLRKEEEDFVGKLVENGVPAKYVCYPECTHGFTHEIFSYHQGNAEAAINEICGFIASSCFKENEIRKDGAAYVQIS